MFQVLHGCEYDDETPTVLGFNHHSYDADTTMVLDMKRRQWIWLQPQLEPTGRKWNLNEGWLAFMEERLLNECPNRLNKTLESGKSILQRTRELLKSLAQQICGFYPHLFLFCVFLTENSNYLQT